ncbi:RNA-directed DNA polymerase from mobile element jockey [Caerostris extrusa]|uniref:RNA-directed DNA polymerase from mobile element jockey n=1 Tax=Caerostris extrusa TaxID=172846 RepID=A0AAV4VYA9_CAEEX|nr:RNA-directed DNA polymerase from mobile element jockey [Caerostris extrusa]
MPEVPGKQSSRSRQQPGTYHRQKERRQTTTSAAISCDTGANVIVAGDFNARHPQWNVGNQNDSGRILHRFIKNRIELKLIAPNVPTKVDFYKNVYSTLDLAIFKNIPFNYNINVLNELSSDHFPVIIELETDISNLKLPQQLLTNWEDFRYLLQTKPLPPLNLSNPTDADSALSNVVDTMQEALRNSSRPKFSNNNLRLPKNIKDLIKSRNHARKTWQRTRHPDDLRNYYRLKDDIKDTIRSYGHKYTDYASSVTLISELSISVAASFYCCALPNKIYNAI